MNTSNADPSFTVRSQDCQVSIARQGMLELRNLIAFGKIGIKIILASEYTGLGNVALQRQGYAQGVLNRALINYR
jgi:hypothetical protein